VKLSISLSDEDVAELDAYIKNAGLPSRSAGLRRAIQMLRHPTLEEDYRNAWIEGSADQAVWDQSVGDGFDDAPR
jgi:metal-responsive CopG/Arc/MetJ family transcriptional regulator